MQDLLLSVASSGIYPDLGGSRFFSVGHGCTCDGWLMIVRNEKGRLVAALMSFFKLLAVSCRLSAYLGF